MIKLTRKRLHFILTSILKFDIPMEYMDTEEIDEFYIELENVVLGNGCILSFFNRYTEEYIEELSLKCIYDVKNYIDSLYEVE